MRGLVKELKENNQDFEFYPTTQEIVDGIYKKIDGIATYERLNIDNILDIGCGDGSFFRKLDICKKNFSSSKIGNKYFGIEKSSMLISKLDGSVILLGTDFHEQTLLDKKVDMIFCNPPYSEYEMWISKIIREANATILVFVIPDRWKDSKMIQDAIEEREWQEKNIHVISNFSFMDAERKARANVDVIIINNSSYKAQKDAFSIWFDKTFKINTIKLNDSNIKKEEIKEKLEIMQGENLAENLIALYQKDLEHLYNNYKALESLDPIIFKELDVSIENLKTSLSSRISGLKTLYWNELFSKYSYITKRLTKKSKKSILNTLNSSTTIDFTLRNIQEVTLWVIRNSNSMFDKQITDIFKALSNYKSIMQYKSNKRFSNDDWRFIKDSINQANNSWSNNVYENKKKLKNYQLDYRIVVDGGYWNTNFDSYSDRDGKYRLSEKCYDFITDIISVAENLGFSFEPFEYYEHRYINEWKSFEILTTKGEVFANVKLYKNGNKHFKFNKKFMKLLNLEASRINGWIKTKEEAEKNINDITKEDIKEFWVNKNRISLDFNKVLQIENKKES